jgi:response regulator RpfG family c-di-GMP phosphodiesterase
LVAAHPNAWRALQTMLADVVDVIPAHTMDEALKILKRDRIDLIICTVAFDESQMMDFLQAVKQTTAVGSIPFLCSRVLKGVLRDSLVDVMRDACKEAGAVDMIDIANLPADRAETVLRAAVLTYLEPTN